MEKKSRSVILPEYNDNLLRALLSLKIGQMEIPEPISDEVVVEMAAAPCNPSDIAFLRGGYNIKKPLPAVPGFEGTGKVVNTGPDAKELLGKRVCCFVQADNTGTWAEQFISTSSDCFVITDKIDDQQAACMFVNPLTAYGMFASVKKSQSGAFIQNAAGGQVADFLNTLADRNSIDVINLVRKEETAKYLKDKGFKYVINTSGQLYQSELKELIHQLKPLILYDAVAGDLPCQVLNLMPDNSQMIVYGALSGVSLNGLNPMEIIFRNKTVSGFNLNDWIQTLSKEEFGLITSEIQNSFLLGDFHTNIQSVYKLDDVVKGIRNYIKSMSSGKILLTP